MQAQEALQKLLRKIATGAFGQVPEVRTIQGRQLMFLSNAPAIFALPYTESDDLQETDLASPNFGEYFFMVDFDAVDGGRRIR